MPLTDDQLAQIRRHIGSQPDDAALNVIEARVTDPDLIALEVLETKYADMVVNDPAQWATAGDASENWKENLAPLAAKIKALRTELGLDTETPAGSWQLSTARLRRDDRPDTFLTDATTN